MRKWYYYKTLLLEMQGGIQTLRRRPVSVRIHFPCKTEKPRNHRDSGGNCRSGVPIALHIVIPDRLLFGVPVLILVLPGQRRLPVGFCFPDTFGVRLTVFRHGSPSYRFVLGPSDTFLLLWPWFGLWFFSCSFASAFSGSFSRFCFGICPPPT